MSLFARLGLLATLVLSLAACGGSGGDTPEPAAAGPPPATASAEDTTNAASSQLTMTLRADNNQLTITWTDTFPAEIGYKVEMRATDGTWQTLESLAPTSTTGSPYQWQRVIDSSTTYRVTATRDGYSVPLQTSGGQAEIAIQLSGPMALEINQTNPVHGVAQLSTSNAVDVQSVHYYLDFQTLASSDIAPTFSMNWNSATATDGNHLLLALVRKTSGATIELRREVVVDNPNVAVSLDITPQSTAQQPVGGGSLQVTATATADAGIAYVEFFFNGNSVRTLTTPTAPREYRFYYNGTGLPRGSNIVRVVAVDNAGDSAETQREIFIDNGPTITIDSPGNGAIVKDTLHLQGTFGDDAPGVTLTATLGAVQILQSSVPGAFSVDYSLAGVAGGEYTLRVVATDSNGSTALANRNIVVSGTPLVYEFITTDVSRLLATDQGTLLYKKLDGRVVLRNAAGVETTLQTQAGIEYSDETWQLDGGHVVVRGTDLAQQTRSVYLFDAAGQPTNISQPSGPITFGAPVLRAPWLIWVAASTNDFTIYNLNTQARLTVPRPAGTTFIGDREYDFVTTPGQEQLLFWARVGVSGNHAIVDIYRHPLSTGVSERLTNGGVQQLNVSTDNDRLAWRKAPLGVFQPPYELVVAPVANPTAQTTLSSTMSTFALRDGVLAWTEAAGALHTLKVNDSVGTTTFSSDYPYEPIVANGRVVFAENRKLHVWSRAAGKSVLLDGWSAQWIQNDGVAFIANGPAVFSLYRVQLP